MITRWFDGRVRYDFDASDFFIACMLLSEGKTTRDIVTAFEYEGMEHYKAMRLAVLAKTQPITTQELELIK